MMKDKGKYIIFKCNPIGAVIAYDQYVKYKGEAIVDIIIRDIVINYKNIIDHCETCV